MKHIPALDGLRAIAILAVVANHVATAVVPGGFGVMLFFVISGFIITRLLLQSPTLTVPALQGFYLKRFFRLAPALFVFLVASGVLMMATGHVIPTRDYAATLLYYANYHRYTTFGPVSSPLVVTWSLAVEEHFYLLFPVVLLFFRRHLVPVLVATLVVVMAWRCVLVFGMHAPVQRTYCGTDTRLDAIAWGCLLSALMRRDGDAPAWAGSRIARLAAVAALAASFAVRSDAFRETLGYSLQGFALFVALHVLFRASAGPSMVRALLESKPMQFVGKISYSLYLYHFLALCVMMEILPSGRVRMASTLVAGFTAAYLSHRFVEWPLRRFGARLAKRVGKLEDAAGPAGGLGA